jgi:hypothetical protein
MSLLAVHIENEFVAFVIIYVLLCHRQGIRVSFHCHWGYKYVNIHWIRPIIWSNNRMMYACDDERAQAHHHHIASVLHEINVTDTNQSLDWTCWWLVVRIEFDMYVLRTSNNARRLNPSLYCCRLNIHRAYRWCDENILSLVNITLTIPVSR